MSFCVSEIKMPRKRVECLRTRGMQYCCDEIVGGSTSECVPSVSLADETGDEEDDNTEYAAKWV